MQTLFGIPTTALAAALAGLTAAAAVVTLLLALRNPVLVRLGIRHIPRRRARSVLIVIGLALSTTIVAASFTTGDALGYTLRALVSGSLGNVDAVVVSYGQGMRRLTLLMARCGLFAPVLRGARRDPSLRAALFDAVSAHAPYAEVLGQTLRPAAVLAVLRGLLPFG